MKASVIILGLLVGLAGTAATAAAHLEYGIDTNLDGDCDDPGEQHELGGPLEEDLGCIPADYVP